MMTDTDTDTGTEKRRAMAVQINVKCNRQFNAHRIECRIFKKHKHPFLPPDGWYHVPYLINTLYYDGRMNIEQLWFNDRHELIDKCESFVYTEPNECYQCKSCDSSYGYPQALTVCNESGCLVCENCRDDHVCDAMN